MEALKKLEEMQRVLSLVASHGLSTDDPESDRFLAHFLLFLIQMRGMLDMERTFRVISESLPKISLKLLEEAQGCATVEDCKEVNVKCPISQLHSENKIGIFPSRAFEEDMVMIGLDSMQRANSTLQDFCRSYFMFHGMDVNEPSAIFRFLPVLSFTESYIYQLDSLNEEILSPAARHCSLGKGGNQRSPIFLMNASETDPLRPLIFLLGHHGLMTERIRAELGSGIEYWALERKLCQSLINGKEVLMEDVMRAIQLKSFDYRVLNLLLYHLREQPPNDLHMEFLSISEFLGEVSDDLFDYEDDVVRNNFNILRMFARVYGASMAPTFLAKCISDAEEKYERLLKSLDPELAFKYTRRCEEATQEGGEVAGHALGRWNIPPVIADEEAYRSRISSTG